MRPTVHGDHRGSFYEVWRADVFAQSGINATFVQDNHSSSSKGILRGLHYQVQQTQGKLVRVTAGAIFDVAVDIRRSSPTFGKWVGITLSAENHTQLFIPPGFAHGFYVLSEQAAIAYKCTDYYAPQHERTLLYSDPSIGIDWPIEPGTTPTMSAKDLAGKPLAEADTLP